MAITYQTEGIKMPDIKKRETTEWIKAVAATYEKRIGEIAYIFCSDEKILEMNRQYLQHDYYTLLMKKNSTGQLFTVYSTFAESTTRVLENVKLWKLQRIRH